MLKKKSINQQQKQNSPCALHFLFKSQSVFFSVGSLTVFGSVMGKAALQLLLALQACTGNVYLTLLHRCKDHLGPQSALTTGRPQLCWRFPAQTYSSTRQSQHASEKALKTQSKWTLCTEPVEHTGHSICWRMDRHHPINRCMLPQSLVHWPQTARRRSEGFPGRDPVRSDKRGSNFKNQWNI